MPQLDHFEQCDWMETLEPGTIVRARNRVGILSESPDEPKWDLWVRVSDGGDQRFSDMWLRLRDGVMRHHSWLADGQFPPKVVAINLVEVER